MSANKCLICERPATWQGQNEHAITKKSSPKDPVNDSTDDYNYDYDELQNFLNTTQVKKFLEQIKTKRMTPPIPARPQKNPKPLKPKRTPQKTQDDGGVVAQIERKIKERTQEEAERKCSLFNQIFSEVKKALTPDFIAQLRTTQGNTQIPERLYMSRIHDILKNKMNLKFEEASSQKPYDFRIKIPNSDDILLLEVKKTDSNTIYFNDTCPTEKAFYIIIVSGKMYKTKADIPPRVLGVNGSVFTKYCPWIKPFSEELGALKEKYRHMPGNMSVYPRPTFKSDISFLPSP